MAFLVAAVATIVFEAILLQKTRAPQFPPLGNLSPLQGLQRKMRRLIRSHQIRYSDLAGEREVVRSNPGWSVIAFLRRSFAGGR